MKKKIKLLIFLLTILVISGCSDSKKEFPKDKYEIRKEKQKKLDTLNINEAKKLSKTANAIIGWDTAEHFTYSLQELFKTSRRPISFTGEIMDIIKKDSFYIMKIASNSRSYTHDYIAEITVTTAMFQDLKSRLNPQERNEGCFIFPITKIISYQPILKSEVESNGDETEDASSDLTLDFDETIIKFQGNLITYYLYQQLKKHDGE